MNNTEQVKASLKKRYAREKRFRAYGILAIITSFLFLVTLLTDITSKALPAFTQTWVQISVDFSPGNIGIDEVTAQSVREGKFRIAVRKSLYKDFPEVKKRKQKNTVVITIRTHSP